MRYRSPGMSKIRSRASIYLVTRRKVTIGENKTDKRE